MNVPTRYTTPLSTARRFTALFGLGRHDRTVPVEVSMAAALVRGSPFTSVNDPPMYKTLPTWTMVLTKPWV